MANSEHMRSGKIVCVSGNVNEGWQADASNIKAAQEIFELVGSIGGARPKAVIYRKGNCLISGLLANPPEGYKPEIIKISQLPGLDFGKVEHICHLMAAKAGITAMRTETMTIVIIFSLNALIGGGYPNARQTVRFGFSRLSSSIGKHICCHNSINP